MTLHPDLMQAVVLAAIIRMPDHSKRQLVSQVPARVCGAMDFVHDPLATGRKLRILTVVDTFSRLPPVIDPRFSYYGEDVVATLERVYRKIGYPKTVRVDNGSEFVSRDVDSWAYQRGVILDFSRPGKPPTTPSSKRSAAS